MKISIKVLHCKKCRTDYNNPLTHVCQLSMRELGVPAANRKTAAERAAAAKKAKKGGR